MKKIAIITALLAVVSSPMALAQKVSNTSEGYFGVEVGFATVKNTSGEAARLLTSTLGGTANVSQSSNVTVYRGYGGFNLNENVAIELAYLTTSDGSVSVSGVSGGAVAYGGSITAQAAGFDYGFIFRPSISSGLNGLFFRLGAHSLTTKYSGSVTVGGTSASGSDSDVGPGSMAGVGYDYPIGNNGFIRAAYTRMDKVSGFDESADLLTIGYQKRF